MATTLPQNVTRWAYLIDQALSKRGVHAPGRAPLHLIQVFKESRGNPAARNKGSNAVGLGQQFAWTPDGKRYLGKPLGGGKHGEPWVHPSGTHGNGKYPITWRPRDQIEALVGLLHDQVNLHTGGHLPSGLIAYASGAGNLRKYVEGQPVADHVKRQLGTYLPSAAGMWDAASSWYHGWVSDGRPTYQGTVVSGDGKTYSVMFAKHEVTPASPLESPFDGTLRYHGKSRPHPASARKSRGNVNPAGLVQTSAAASTGGLLLTATITAALSAATYLGVRYATSPGGKRTIRSARTRTARAFRRGRDGVMT